VEPRIDVDCQPEAGGWACRVTLTEGDTSTTHEVTIATADLTRLAPGDAAPDDLVRRSFGFLLAHEPKESILRRFDLPVIGRYFPDWEREISRSASP
jgi:hypothetical protein